MAKERAAVAPRHIAEHRRIVVVAVAKAGLARLPRGVFFVLTRRPRAGLGVAFAPLPPAAPRRHKNSGLSHGRPIAKPRRAPMAGPRRICKRVDALHGRSDARAGRRPRESDAIFDRLDDLAAAVCEHELLALVAELARKRPDGFHGELFFERSGVLRDDEVSARIEGRAGREDELVELPSAELRRSIARIKQLDELQRTLVLRVEMDLVDHDTLRSHCTRAPKNKQPSLQTNHALNIRFPPQS